MADLGDHGLDLPYEDGPSGQHADLGPMQISGGVVVMAVTVPVPGVGIKPALVFRFATPLGEFYDPVLLVLDQDQINKLPDLVAKAVRSAAETARRAS